MDTKHHTVREERRGEGQTAETVGGERETHTAFGGHEARATLGVEMTDAHGEVFPRLRETEHVASVEREEGGHVKSLGVLGHDRPVERGSVRVEKITVVFPEGVAHLGENGSGVPLRVAHVPEGQGVEPVAENARVGQKMHTPVPGTGEAVMGEAVSEPRAKPAPVPRPVIPVVEAEPTRPVVGDAKRRELGKMVEIEKQAEARETQTMRMIPGAPVQGPCPVEDMRGGDGVHGRSSAHRGRRPK
jgi:hypothetical protein